VQRQIFLISFNKLVTDSSVRSTWNNTITNR